jgi:hypothetical protein
MTAPADISGLLTQSIFIHMREQKCLSLSVCLRLLSETAIIKEMKPTEGACKLAGWACFQPRAADRRFWNAMCPGQN